LWDFRETTFYPVRWLFDTCSRAFQSELPAFPGFSRLTGYVDMVGAMFDPYTALHFKISAIRAFALTARIAGELIVGLFLVLKILQRWLGHARIESTAIYASAILVRAILRIARESSSGSIPSLFGLWHSLPYQASE
jgi:hypothetical protein